MEIIRLTVPSYPTLTDGEIATWLRIDSGQDPETIDMLVSSATEYVEGITGLALGACTYRVTLDGIDECYRLPLSPIQSVSMVQYRDRAGVLTTLDGWHYASGCIYFASYPPGCPIVTLEAGYPTVQLIPSQLRHAIAVLVSAGYNGREEMTDQTVKTVANLCQRHKRYGW